MFAFEMIAEKRIAEAAASGEFDNLPGSGKPLDLEEDPLVPEDLRMAYRILRNAGYVPAEVEAASREGRGGKILSLLNARVESRYFSRAARKFAR